jgi:hypothetical protein
VSPSHLIEEMPDTSELADKLADDLVLVGKILGFGSEKEAPVKEGSTYCVDVLWKLLLPKGSPFPVANVASIEIQYSNSPASISHNIFKAEPTLHPAIHIVVSYSSLTANYKEILKLNYPSAGLVIFEGEEKVEELNSWISDVIANKNKETGATEAGKNFLKFVNNQMEKRDTHLQLEQLFEPVVFEMTIESHFDKDSRGFECSFFVVGTIEVAKKRALQRFEEEMMTCLLNGKVGMYC